MFCLSFTFRKDFGELVFRQRLVHAGGILVRPAGLSSDTKARVMVEVLRRHESKLPDSFSVISPGNVRIRQALTVFNRKLGVSAGRTGFAQPLD